MSYLPQQMLQICWKTHLFGLLGMEHPGTSMYLRQQGVPDWQGKGTGVGKLEGEWKGETPSIPLLPAACNPRVTAFLSCTPLSLSPGKSVGKRPTQALL